MTTIIYYIYFINSFNFNFALLSIEICDKPSDIVSIAIYYILSAVIR